MPTTFNYLFGPTKRDKQVRMINCNYFDGDVTIRKIDYNAMLWVDLSNLNYPGIIKNKIKSPIRGYDYIQINLEPGYRPPFKNLVYYDGLIWRRINN